MASYLTCQLNDKTAKPAPAPLLPVELPNGPWQKIAIDIVGPFESATWDCRYSITLVDYYSKWPEVALASHVTTDVITTFLDTIFSREGNPHCLVSDNGPQLTSMAFADFLKERNIQHIYSSVYYPQANGAVERFNRVLKQCIQSAIQEKKPWKACCDSSCIISGRRHMLPQGLHLSNSCVAVRCIQIWMSCLSTRK